MASEYPATCLAPSVYSTSACSTTDRVGHCVKTTVVSGSSSTLTIYYYRPMTVAEARAICDEAHAFLSPSGSAIFTADAVDPPSDVTGDVQRDAHLDSTPDVVRDSGVDVSSTDTRPDAVPTDTGTDVPVAVDSGATDVAAADTGADAGVDVPAAVDAGTDVPCTAVQTRCAGGCTNVQTDNRNCGACGVSCAEFQACTAGVCGTDCRGQTLCGSVCHDITRDNENCGACGTVCPPLANGISTCAASVCAASCNHGYALIGGVCVLAPLPAPRLIAPLSNSIATSNRPTLRWQLAAATDGVRIDVCSDRACLAIVQTFDVAGTTGAPTTSLAAGTWYWRARPMNAGALTGGTASSTWELRVRAMSAVVNTAWGTTPDFNGDGFADVIVTSVASERAFVYAGSAAGIPTTPTTTIVTPTAGNGFGRTVTSAGDVNGDGFGDVMVTAGGIPQRIFVYHGSATGLGSAPATTITSASADGASSAMTPYGLGDVNGDGYGDMMFGFAGVAKLHYGSPAGLASAPGLTLFGPAPGAGSFGWPPDSTFGVSTPAGDTNGDGFADAIVVTRSAIETHHGGNAGLSIASSRRITVEASLATGANDVNGDGYADVLAGSFNPTLSVYVYHGAAAGLGTTATTSIAVPTSSSFALRADGAWDVNGDGFDDLLIARAGASDGTAFIHHGSSTGVSATPARTLTASLLARNFGLVLSAAGDVHNDGFADLLIVSPNVSVFFYRGSAAGIPATATTTLNAPAGTTFFGSSVASLNRRFSTPPAFADERRLACFSRSPRT